MRRFRRRGGASGVGEKGGAMVALAVGMVKWQRGSAEG